MYWTGHLVRFLLLPLKDEIDLLAGVSNQSLVTQTNARDIDAAPNARIRIVSDI